MSYSIGSKPREGIRAEKDGQAVTNLKNAGGIPLAVSNTPEFCAFYETYNFITGYTRNPYDPHRTVGGSSGGEAALISSAASVIGIGSDFAGTIRIPCMFTGVFGHKPTPGIIPPDGHFPYVSSTEFSKYFTIGILTRYAEDLKPLLRVLAGDNAKNLRLERPVFVKDVNVYYVPAAYYGISISNDIQKAIVNTAFYLYKNQGCSVRKIDFEEFRMCFEICASVFTAVDSIRSNLQFISKNTNVMFELLKSFFKLSDYTMDYTILRFLILARGFISQKKKKVFFETRDLLNRKLSELLKDNGVLLFPTFPGPAFYRRQQYVKSAGACYSVLFNVLGYPATHVPIGLNKQKLPIGFQVVAAPYQDRLCIAVAQRLEVVYGGWVPPPVRMIF